MPDTALHLLTTDLLPAYCEAVDEGLLLGYEDLKD